MTITLRKACITGLLGTMKINIMRYYILDTCGHIHATLEAENSAAAIDLFNRAYAWGTEGRLHTIEVKEN